MKANRLFLGSSLKKKISHPTSSPLFSGPFVSNQRGIIPCIFLRNNAHVALPELSSEPTTTPLKFHLGKESEAVPVKKKSLNEGDLNIKQMTNEAIVELLLQEAIAIHKVEALLGDPARAVTIRRTFHEKKDSFQLTNIPFENYDYQEVVGACCENVVGYIPVPIGLAGPIMVDGKMIPIPMATTEGTLVASTHRGCKAVTLSGGTKTAVYNNGMTRAPVIKFPSAVDAVEAKQWLENEENAEQIKAAFNSTSRFAKLREIRASIAGNHLYVRFKSETCDAMGMNMVSKGSEAALSLIIGQFPSGRVLSLSGNMCTDKKPSAINWIEGRGKSVVAEAVIPASIVESVLKTNIEDLVETNISKNLIGSAMAGSIGGFNAHAANIVTAVFLATGQDVAQNVESSNCITLFESVSNGEAVRVSCTMPSLEVGTIGGGTHLKAQSTCLDLMGVKGPNKTSPGLNAQQLAKYICSAVLAGELSLMSALTAGHLVRSHMFHNRKKNL